MTAAPDTPHGAPRWALGLLAAAALVLGACAAWQVWWYLTVPVDLVSWSESPFITEVIKLRLGIPLYTPVSDHSAYPYTPLAPILTHALGTLAGRGTDIPALRLIQFGYTLLAVALAVRITDRLARRGDPPAYLARRRWWLAIWAPLLFLVALDGRFSAYVIALHNDGLALLVSVAGFWLATEHATSGRRWPLWGLALLPGIGFLVKQNQAMWLGLAAILLVVDGRLSWRLRVVVGIGCVASLAAAIAWLLRIGGPNTTYWLFEALGDKSVSPARAVLHGVWGAPYFALAALGLVALVIRRADRPGLALAAVWVTLMGLQTWTSGLGFTANHMGSGVLLGACWFFAALPTWWPAADAAAPRWRGPAEALAGVLVVLGLVAGLGVVREPRDLVSTDLPRFVADVEAAFAGHDPERVLLDNGSWIYLRAGVLQKDRSAPVTLHIGINQPTINRAALQPMIDRIRSRAYDRIIKRIIATDESPYDPRNRGSGVDAAINAHYRLVGRIPGVRGVSLWWPANLLSDHLIYEPRPPADSTAPPR